MIAAIYSRKSKFTGKGESIENQIQMCEEYGRKIGIEDFIIYEDEGYSGSTINRPKFKTMLKDAVSKKFHVVICYRLDRISRNISDFSNTIAALSKLSIGFISIKEQFDTSTPMGRAMMYISSVFAQLERETIAERIRDNMYELAKSGRWLGGTPPFGYTSEPVVYLDENLKQKKFFKLSPIKNELQLVSSIYDLYLKLGSLSRLKSYLYKNNIKTRNNNDWDIKALQLLLRNPVYVRSSKTVIDYLSKNGIHVFGKADGCGILTYNKRDSKANYKELKEWVYAVSKHLGIIEDELWLKVQYKMDENKALAPRLISESSGLLNGILKCCCGAPMHQKTGHIRADGNVSKYYVCTNKIKYGALKCKGKNIRADIIEAALLNKLFEIISLEKQFKAQIQEYKNLINIDSTEKEIASINESIFLAEKQINNLVDQLSLDTSIVKYILPKIEKLNIKLEALKSRKTQLTESNPYTEAALSSINGFSSMLLSLKSLFENVDFNSKKQLINSMVEAVYFNGESYEIDIKLNEEAEENSHFGVGCI